MTKSLLSILLGIGVLVALLLLILRKGFWGPVILLALAALYFVVTFLSEFVKLFHGKKVQSRDRHA